MSFHFRRSRSSRQEDDHEKLAIVTIGGTEVKNPAVVVAENKSYSPVLNDVGNLA